MLVVHVPERSLLQDAAGIRHLEQDDRTTVARRPAPHVVEERADARDVLEGVPADERAPGKVGVVGGEPLPADANRVELANRAGGVDARAVRDAELDESMQELRLVATAHLDDGLFAQPVTVDPVLRERIPECAVVGRVRGSLDAARRVLGEALSWSPLKRNPHVSHASSRTPRGTASDSSLVAGKSAAFTGIDGQWRIGTRDEPEHDGHPAGVVSGLDSRATLHVDRGHRVDDGVGEREHVRCGRVVPVRVGDHAHPCRVRRADPARGVLDRDAPRRIDAQAPRRLEVDVGAGLPRADLLRRHGDREERRRARAAASTASISSRFEDEATASA